MDKYNEKLKYFMNQLECFTKTPEDFLDYPVDNGENIKNLVKNIYDFVKSTEKETESGNALPELIIENFDDEQIWQEIELQNNDSIDKFTSAISYLEDKKDELIFPIRVKNKSSSVKKKEKILKSMKMDLADDIKSSEDDDENDNDNFYDEDGELDSDNEELMEKKSNDEKKKRNQKPSIVDDKFFKLSEMEEFLLAEEKREENNTDSNDFGIDLFGDIPLTDEDNDDSDEDKMETNYKYKDFFAKPSDHSKSVDTKKLKMKYKNSGNSNLDEENDELEDEDKIHEEEDFEMENDEAKEHVNDKPGKQVRFNLSDDSGDDMFTDANDQENINNDHLDNSSAESDSDFDNNKNVKKSAYEVKSSLEKRKERLSKHINKLEEQAISEKPWQMKGEISASARPQNSLLEEVLDFDVTARPAPVMTEETTERLEDIITRRIKDKAWDDVERKLKPVETVNEFKKRLVLDQEKSKLSLAEIYEQEYIKQRDAAATAGVKTEQNEPEELPEHKQIRTMMVTLFSKLNALTNYHYTPKLAAPDVKIVSNLPAITMEEVAPVSASDATLLAPEEVMGKKKKDLIGKEERTKTDKKREKRKKKHWQKMKRKVQEAKEALKDSKSKKYTVEEAAGAIKKLSNNRNVQIKTSGNNKVVKTSATFFSRLQDEVKSKVHDQIKDKVKEKSSISAKKLKL